MRPDGTPATLPIARGKAQSCWFGRHPRCRRARGALQSQREGLGQAGAAWLVGRLVLAVMPSCRRDQTSSVITEPVRISTVVILVVVLGAGATACTSSVTRPTSRRTSSSPWQAFRARPRSRAAEANLAGAVSAANSYQLDHSGYAGMSAGDLRKYGQVAPRRDRREDGDLDRVLHREHRERCDGQHPRAERHIRCPGLLTTSSG